ncbi:MAG: histidinol-phosphatase HisJ family protein [Syntrophomonadaceae bacterium]|jgi:histidinol-phosphatase (PHP family)|nr:histidinol-phosphatase HisJ family protein [Syntrophomonadaceae bacterium]
MYVDYHIHALGHQGQPYKEELLTPFLFAAREQGIKEIGFAEHDEYLECIDEGVITSLKEKFPDLTIKLGLEISFRPGREQEIKLITNSFSFDYLIGSIHDVEGFRFDHPAYRDGYRNWDIDELYRLYYDVLKKMACCGLFDIVGHLDAVKVFGYRPEKDPTPFIEPVLQAISRAGLVVEVNTAGLRKPCAEIYPSHDLLIRCYELDIPVTLSSDAHTDSDVGRDLAFAKEILYRTGYRRVAVFTQRQRSFFWL